MDILEPIYMPHRLLKQITDDFSDQRLLGRGTFGVVYKGEYEDAQVIAVKVLKYMEGVEDNDFHREFNNLAKLKHENIVQLLGFCNETERVIVDYGGRKIQAEKIHRALCFEYMHNRSLNEHLSDVTEGFGWHKRYRIIKGICEGLRYLRMGLEKPVYHLDLKPANILLNKNMVPKIADFGLSRLLGEESTKRTLTSVGTVGYLPPEYITKQLISKEFDIFSLGVIIIKIMIGRKGYYLIDEMTQHEFCEHVCNKWRERLQKLPGYTILETVCQQVQICTKIALKCIETEKKKRPTIDSIVTQLKETEKHTNDPGSWIEEIDDRESIPPTSSTPVNRPPGTTSDAGRGKRLEREQIPKELPLEFLKDITLGFSQERILSEGAFGTVYKGILENGQKFAVMKLAGNLQVPAGKQFHKVATNLMAVQHENIVKLLSWCSETKKKVVESKGKFILVHVDECVLCYEYVPKGSLHNYLSDDTKRTDWDTHFKIIKGICMGLQFLHEGTVDPIVHLDLQPANILLDDDMVPKIAHFGLSRLFDMEQSRMYTMNVVGLKGYMAPEYLYRGEISRECDIYSLGALIIEITTREKNCSNDKDLAGRKFIASIRQTWTDEHITSNYLSLDSERLQQVKTCIDIGLKCVAVAQKNRPSIREIVDSIHMVGKKVVTVSTDLLDVYPAMLRLPLKPNMLIACSLNLMNKTDDCVAVRLLTKSVKRYMAKMPLCGLVPPKSAYTLVVTRSNLKKQPLVNADEFLTLESTIVGEGDTGLNNASLDFVAIEFNNFFKEAKETAADKVYEIKLGVVSDPPYEATTGQKLQSEVEIISDRTFSQVLSVEVHTTEPWILMSNHAGDVVIWDYQEQAPVNSFDFTQKPVYSAKFLEREKWIVAGDADGSIYIYSYDTEEEIADIEAHEGGIMSLAVHPTHPFMLSSSEDNLIKLWDWQKDWECTRTFEGHSSTVTQVNFNQMDTDSFASASLDHTIKIWNIYSSESQVTLSDRPDRLLCVHYYTSDSRQYLLTGSRDGTAQIWDLEIGSCVQMLKGHVNPISSVYWHPQLPVVITGSHDGTVRLWSSTTYRLENIIGVNLGAIYAFAYIERLRRIVVGCHQGIAIMEINLT